MGVSVSKEESQDSRTWVGKNPQQVLICNIIAQSGQYNFQDTSTISSKIGELGQEVT